MDELKKLKEKVEQEIADIKAIDNSQEIEEKVKQYKDNLIAEDKKEKDEKLFAKEIKLMAIAECEDVLAKKEQDDLEKEYLDEPTIPENETTS